MATGFSRHRTVLLVAAAVAACRGAAPAPTPAPRAEAQPAAPAPEAHVHPGATASDSARRGYTAADVRFMQHMIGHHAQALAMTALVPSRTQRRDIRLLAERIEITQRDEIAAMRRWLERRGEPADAGSHAAMPGMLTADELAELGRATGAAFDQLFLRSMIRHHEGAIAMVAALFGAPGAAQDSEMYRLASDVDADQRAEIARMRALQDAPAGGAPRP